MSDNGHTVILPPCDICAMFLIKSEGIQQYKVRFKAEEKEYIQELDLCHECHEYMLKKKGGRFEGIEIMHVLYNIK